MNRFLLVFAALLGSAFAASADMYPDGSNAKLPASGIPAATVCQDASGKLLGLALGCGGPAGVSVQQWGAVPNNAGIDNLAAINAALANGRVPVVIEAGNVYYSSGQVIVPDGAALVLNGTLRRLAAYTVTDCRAFVTQASTVGSSIIGSGTIDLNSPPVGNWLAGLAPTNASTANVVDRDFTITGATCGGLDWYFANQTLTHSNDAFDNIKILNSGGRGAYFAGMRGGHAANLTVVSTGNDAISITGDQDWALVTPYVNKAIPPPVIYNGAAETGMCIFRGPTSDRVTITSPICDDNRNAASDGIGIGENGTTSSTSQTIGAGSKTFTIPAGGVFAAGWAVTIISSASVLANQMYGTVTSWSGTTLVVNITSFKGSGAHTDWIINTEDGTVVLTNPIVRNAGLFGIDCASNFTVVGGEIDNAAQRGINIGRDLGGRLSNCHFSGTTIKNTGPPASGAAAGIFWGATLGNAMTMENISLTGVQVIDDRTNPGTFFGQNFDSGHGNQFANISYDTASVPAPPFGYSKSYNVFGGGTDPHLDGSCFSYTPTLTWSGGTPTAPTSAGCYRINGKTMTVMTTINLGTALNGATAVTVGFPPGAALAISGTLACGSPGGATCALWANAGATGIGFTQVSSFAANAYFSFTGSLLIQ